MGMMLFALVEMVSWFIYKYSQQFLTQGYPPFAYWMWQIIIWAGYLSWVFERRNKQ